MIGLSEKIACGGRRRRRRRKKEDEDEKEEKKSLLEHEEYVLNKVPLVLFLCQHSEQKAC